MTATLERPKEGPKSRVERLLEAHPSLSSVKARGLLISAYKRITRDPSFDGNRLSLETQLESYTDWLIRLSDHALGNEVARVSEHFDLSWDELEAKMNESLDEDI